MNPGHLRAILWLRWRILRNRLRRRGQLSSALLAALLVFGLIVSLGCFVLALALGLSQLPEAEPMELMLVWVGLALAFLFFWLIGLVTDLQRSDAMSFKNLLHLPASLGWVFLYNYLSSFVSVSIALFLPAMLGLCLAMVIVDGARMLLGFPLLLGFFVLITGLTYQLRGWLARLMENKRRGRNIVAAVTVALVLLVQAPNLIGLMIDDTDDEWPALSSQVGEPEALAAEARRARREQDRRAEELALERNVTLGALLIPAGWLPYGVRASREGRWVQGSLCALGMLALGALSLRRSFRVTLRAFVGGGGAGAGSVPVLAGPVASPLLREQAVQPASRARKLPLVERSLPFASERVSGIATASLRGLVRAPEAKLMLLSPVVLLVCFGLLFSSASRRAALAGFGPMMSLGAITLGLLGIVQLLQNQFGLDREGFRAYVLSPVPRAELLLAKNLASAPLGIGIGLIALVLLQLLFPAGLLHFLGSCLQLVSAYLVLCLLGNLLSILNPMRLREGSFKAVNVKFSTVVLQLLSLLVIPLALSPLALPSLVDFLLRWQGWARRVPLYLLLHAVGLVAIAWAYRAALRRQGELLQDREQRILDVLTRD